MNRCIFVGRLTRDPEVSFSEKAQMSIARFTVAVVIHRKKCNSNAYRTDHHSRPCCSEMQGYA